MTNSILRRLAVGGVLMMIALAGILPGRVALATTKTTYVKSCSYRWYYTVVNHKKKWHKKWTCRYVKKGSSVATKSVSAYKPYYNLMTSTGSSKGATIAGATALCGDNTVVYTKITSTTCATHHGIAWKF